MALQLEHALHNQRSYTEEADHAISALKIFSLNVTVPGFYAYRYGDIQSFSHFVWVEKGWTC